MIIFRRVALFMLAWCCVATCSAAADDSAAIRKAFMSLQIVMQDVDGPAGIALSGEPWRIVVAQDTMAALGETNFLFEGITDKKGEARLTHKQRQVLHDTWNQNPETLWFIFASNPARFVPERNNKIVQISVIVPLSEIALKMQAEEAENELAQKTPLPLVRYTQADFNAADFQLDFTEWQKRFRMDAGLAKDALDYPEKHYGQSIDGGTKGLSLRQFLLDANRPARQTEGTQYTPSGKVFADLVLSESARPVGYGGSFMDDGQTVELWYVIFDDMSDWTMFEFKESLVFKAFPSAAVPPYNVTKRDSWPSVVFTRQADGQLMLYAMSREMDAILRTILNAQLF